MCVFNTPAQINFSAINGHTVALDLFCLLLDHARKKLLKFNVRIMRNWETSLFLTYYICVHTNPSQLFKYNVILWLIDIWIPVCSISVLITVSFHYYKHPCLEYTQCVYVCVSVLLRSSNGFSLLWSFWSLSTMICLVPRTRRLWWEQQSALVCLICSVGSRC